MRMMDTLLKRRAKERKPVEAVRENNASNRWGEHSFRRLVPETRIYSGRRQNFRDKDRNADGLLRQGMASGSMWLDCVCVCVWFVVEEEEDGRRRKRAWKVDRTGLFSSSNSVTPALALLCLPTLCSATRDLIFKDISRVFTLIFRQIRTLIRNRVLTGILHPD